MIGMAYSSGFGWLIGYWERKRSKRKPGNLPPAQRSSSRGIVQRVDPAERGPEVPYRRAFFGYRELIFFYGSLILIRVGLQIFFR